MEQEILNNLNDPARLEQLYRKDHSAFRQAFESLYPNNDHNIILKFWNARLNYHATRNFTVNTSELFLVLVAAFLAALIAKIPLIFNINEEYFFTRNTPFVVLPILCAYFAWNNKLSVQKIIFLSISILLSLIFINLFPENNNSDTLILSCIHTALFLWCILGVAFTGESEDVQRERLNFLKFNGDLAIMMALIFFSGAILSAVTMGLFTLIGFKIEQFYFRYVVISGVAAAPILATYLIRSNPTLVGKVSPVIARIFSPIVLIMLLAYLVAIVVSGKNPYNDREFLMIFNALLLGVLAIIFFSVSGGSGSQRSKLEIFVLLSLCILTIIVNLVALSAIAVRVSSWGFTPNRAAILGANLLILINLILVCWNLIRAVRNNLRIDEVGNTISRFLPVYFIWTIIVTFLFPFLFGFR